jgi:hypothetical protein
MMRWWIWPCLYAAVWAAPAQLAAEPACAAPTGGGRLMLHESDVLAARLAHMTKAPDSPEGRVAALRQLFEAAGCPQIVEPSEGKRHNLECFVRGESDDVIIVGANQFYDSIGSVALLPSLAEAMAAAPRKHSFRYVAFSAHETVTDRVNRVQKPKGAMRLIDALSDAERGRVRVMLHVGPVGFGALGSHPDQAGERLACTFAHAANTAGLEIEPNGGLGSDCVESGAGPQSTSRGFMGCRPETDWTGGHEWEPFRRVGIPVFGIHSAAEAKFGGKLDAALYVKSYRMLAIMLALADDALAAPLPVQGSAAASE